MFNNDECVLKINGKEVGSATLGEFTSNEPIPQGEDKVSMRYVGSASFSINSEFRREIIGMLMPNYFIELHEVIKNLCTLEGVELENYIVNVPQILEDINVYAHKYNQIEDCDKIVLGVDEKNKNIVAMLISVEESKYTPSIIPLSINGDIKEILFDKYVDKITVMEAKDSLEKDVLDTLKVSSYIPHPMENSEKRGKKGKKIRNWEKKCFWQKGR